MAPPISPYTGPGWSPPICRVALELRSVFPVFLCDIPHVSMAIILSVSLTPACPCLAFTIGCSSVSLPRIYHRVQFLGRLTRRVTGLTLCPPPRSSRILSFAWTYSPDSLLLMHRHSVAVSLSPSLTVALTPCNCGTLGGLSSWLATYLIPPRVVSLSLPALDACCA